MASTTVLTVVIGSVSCVVPNDVADPDDAALRILPIQARGLISGSKIACAGDFLDVPAGIDSRVASRKVSPSQNFRPTKMLERNASTVTLSLCSSGPRLDPGIRAQRGPAFRNSEQ